MVLIPHFFQANTRAVLDGASPWPWRGREEIDRRGDTREPNEQA